MPSFRLRARTATTIGCASSEPPVHAGLAQPVEIVPIKPVLGTNYIDLRSHGYSEGDAKANAKKLADMLLLVGAKAGYGVDLTQGQIAFGEELTTNYFQKNGEHLIPDILGVLHLAQLTLHALHEDAPQRAGLALRLAVASLFQLRPW
jgi:hypothetical protein